MLAPLLQGPIGPVPFAAGLMVVLIIGSSLLSLIALARAGIQIWWAEPNRVPPTMRLGEIVPVTVLLVGLLTLTIAVQGPVTFLQRTAAEITQPGLYIGAVLGEGEGS
jgi:multicomponent K+:H+ antiporter subunit D